MKKIKIKSICVTHSEYRWAILRTIETNPQNPAKSTNNPKYNEARSCCIENTLSVLSYYEYHLTRPDLKHKTSCRASEPSLGDALVSKGGKILPDNLKGRKSKMDKLLLASTCFDIF